MNPKRLSLPILSALCCALIILGTQIRIPFFFGVPLTLQTPMIQVAALCLPHPYGIYSVGLYLILGAAGFPVFAMGGGIAYLMEKTGGYLLGFLIATLPLQFFRPLCISSRTSLFLALSLHTVVIFLCGIGWHAYLEGLPFLQLAAAMAPFYFAAFIKILFTIFLVESLLKRFRASLKN